MVRLVAAAALPGRVEAVGQQAAAAAAAAAPARLRLGQRGPLLCQARRGQQRIHGALKSFQAGLRSVLGHALGGRYWNQETGGGGRRAAGGSGRQGGSAPLLLTLMAACEAAVGRSNGSKRWAKNGKICSGGVEKGAFKHEPTRNLAVLFGQGWAGTTGLLHLWPSGPPPTTPHPNTIQTAACHSPPSPL